MATAALKLVEARRDVAERLLVLDHGPGREIDDLKEKLRQFAESEGAGFKEDFGDKGFVRVSAGSESKFKGKVPVLDAAAFYGLTEKQRQKLIDDAVVTEELQFTKASRPSVTVDP